MATPQTLTGASHAKNNEIEIEGCEMIGFIMVTVLNSSHQGPSKTTIKASAINAMRNVGEHCALSHKDIEEEVIVEETCASLAAQLNAKPAGKKGAKGWFKE